MRSFVCTDPAGRIYDPGRGKYHPRPWELQTQSHIRELQPPASEKSGNTIVVATEGDGSLSGVCKFGPSLEEGVHVVMLLGVAVGAQRCGVGRALLLGAVEAMRASDEGCVIVARIHPQNEASRALFASVGFKVETPCGVSEPLDLWALDTASDEGRLTTM